MRLNEDFTRTGRLADLGRWHVTRFVESVAAAVAPGALLLDAGAGECAYERFFKHCRYVAMDSAVGEQAWNYANLDSLALLDRLPLRDACLDAVLCTQVLEHLEWPRECVRELYRVLKPGGVLYLTAPMAQAEHQVPHDFFRFTSFGLRSVCGDAGFGRVDVAPFGGLFTRLAYEMTRVMEVIPGSGLLSGQFRLSRLLWAPVRLVALVLVRILQSVLLLLEPLEKEKNGPLGWSVIARK